MPDRTILLGLMTYTDEHGQSRYGLQGETVNVHPDFVDRFDEFNIDPGPPFDPEREPMPMAEPGGGELPKRGGRTRKA
jgi:hypothetical protein